ncbi:MAG: hypothetical protein GY853_06740, partial [PVC group bacterium]|nr:hypothetical protein [PVC group bacterium]
MDAQQLQEYLQRIWDELADLRNGQNIQLVHHAHARVIEQQVANCEVDEQNNLPDILLTVTPNSLLKIFTS